MKCGDICLVQFPFTDGTAAKFRPVVVISADEFNDGEDVVVLPISSSSRSADVFSVLIQKDSPQFVRSGLKYQSSIKCTKPITISNRLLIRKLGVLAPSLLREVRADLAKLFSLA